MHGRFRVWSGTRTAALGICRDNQRDEDCSQHYSRDTGQDRAKATRGTSLNTAIVLHGCRHTCHYGYDSTSSKHYHWNEAANTTRMFYIVGKVRLSKGTCYGTQS